MLFNWRKPWMARRQRQRLAGYLWVFCMSSDFLFHCDTRLNAHNTRVSTAQRDLRDSWQPGFVRCHFSASLQSKTHLRSSVPPSTSITHTNCLLKPAVSDHLGMDYVNYKNTINWPQYIDLRWWWMFWPLFKKNNNLHQMFATLNLL